MYVESTIYQGFHCGDGIKNISALLRLAVANNRLKQVEFLEKEFCREYKTKRIKS